MVRPSRQPALRGRSGGAVLLVLLVLVTLAAVIAGCGSSGTPTGEVVPDPVEATAAPDEDPADIDEEPLISPGADPGEPETTRTETSWGVIWDRLPENFPTFPGSVPSEELPGEPVSGAYLAEADTPEVASWFQAALEMATYSTEALSGPLEDGTMVLDSVGDGGCRIQVEMAPRDGSTVVFVRYGGACPTD